MYTFFRLINFDLKKKSASPKTGRTFQVILQIKFDVWLEFFIQGSFKECVSSFCRNWAEMTSLTSPKGVLDCQRVQAMPRDPINVQIHAPGL